MSIKEKLFEAMNVEAIVDSTIDSISILYGLDDAQIDKIKETATASAVWDHSFPLWLETFGPEFTQQYVENADKLSEFGANFADVIGSYIALALQPEGSNKVN